MRVDGGSTREWGGVNGWRRWEGCSSIWNELWRIVMAGGEGWVGQQMKCGWYIWSGGGRECLHGGRRSERMRRVRREAGYNHSKMMLKEIENRAVRHKMEPSRYTQ